MQTDASRQPLGLKNSHGSSELLRNTTKLQSYRTTAEHRNHRCLVLNSSGHRSDSLRGEDDITREVRGTERKGREATESSATTEGLRSEELQVSTRRQASGQRFEASGLNVCQVVITTWMRGSSHHRWLMVFGALT